MSDDEQEDLIENTSGPGFVGIQFCQEWYIIIVGLLRLKYFFF